MSDRLTRSNKQRKKKYSGIGPSELRRSRQLEEEDRKLKQIVRMSAQG